MKWIKYQIVCNESLNILLDKKLEYTETNMLIAQREAYQGEYSIIEDDTTFPSMNPAELVGLKSKRIDKTIAASDWQTISGVVAYKLEDESITSTCIVELIPDEEITLEQLQALQAAQIYNSAQNSGVFVIVCLGDVPSIDIPVTFIIRRDL